MSRLTFAPVPNGPLPLFIGEPRDDISAQGHLCCDHLSKLVHLRAADPYEPFDPRRRSVLNRFSVWEVDAMMPRDQIRAIYESLKPLVERLDEGVSIQATPQGWARSQTTAADVAYECIDEALDVPVEAPVAWTPLRTGASLDISIADLLAAGFTPQVPQADLESAMLTRLKVNAIRASEIRNVKSSGLMASGTMTVRNVRLVDPIRPLEAKIITQGSFAKDPRQTAAVERMLRLSSAAVRRATRDPFS